MSPVIRPKTLDFPLQCSNDRNKFVNPLLCCENDRFSYTFERLNVGKIPDQNSEALLAPEVPEGRFSFEG